MRLIISKSSHGLGNFGCKYKLSSVSLDRSPAAKQNALLLLFDILEMRRRLQGEKEADNSSGHLRRFKASHGDEASLEGKAGGDVLFLCPKLFFISSSLLGDRYWLIRQSPVELLNS